MVTKSLIGQDVLNRDDYCFPNRLEDIQELVKHHQTLPERLLWAAYFDSNGNGVNSTDVFLLEVYDDEPAVDWIDGDDLLDVQYGPTNSFFLWPGSYLHLIVCNPEDLEKALAQNTKLIKCLKKAHDGNKFKVIFKDDTFNVPESLN